MSDPSTRSFVGHNSPDGITVGLSATTPVSFYGAAPVAQVQVAAAGADAATTQALANSIRTILINLGVCRA